MSSNRVETKQFTFTKNKSTFVAEASDLGTEFGPQRLYPDAADVGLVLISSKTGKEAVYVFSDFEKRDGDLISWTYLPTKETLKQFPALRGTKVVIYND